MSGARQSGEKLKELLARVMGDAPGRRKASDSKQRIAVDYAEAREDAKRRASHGR